MYNIEFYSDCHGKSEVYDYLKNLKANLTKENKQKLKKIDLYIDLLAEYGFSLNEPYIKKLTGKYGSCDLYAIEYYLQVCIIIILYY